MDKCPLCTGSMLNGKCEYCGYQAPDEASVAAPYNYDPSDYNMASAAPAKQNDGMMEGISVGDVNMMDYVNGSGAVNVGDGQYNALNAPEYQEARNAAPMYTRDNPAPFITKDTSLQEDMRNFFNVTGAAGPGVSGRINTPPRNNANTYGSYTAPSNNTGNPYGSFNPSANNNGNPYANFTPGPVNETPQNPLKNISLPSLEDNTDYDSLNTSEKIVKKTSNFVLRNGWQFVLLFLLPSVGFIIALIRMAKFKTGRKPIDFVLGIVFIFISLGLKTTGFDIFGIDSALWSILRHI